LVEDGGGIKVESKKSGFFILISIVAFLSLTLVLLAGYIFFVGGNVGIGQAAGSKKEIVVPKDKELALEQMFDSNTAFNLLTTKEDKDIHVILVNVQVQYFKKFDGIKDTTFKIQSNKSKLSEIVGTYFQNLSIDEVKDPNAKEKARAELKKMMNDHLMQNEKKDGDLVYSVIFDYWFYQ
jgi:flagellar basal body-associated protein FliL